MRTNIRHILLAEDNENDAELTLAALRENRLVNNVVWVRDGSEVLDYLYRRHAYADRHTEQPGVILLDLKMPKVDGIEVLRQVKSDATLKTLPIVVLTASREEQDLVRSYDLGVNAYVVKPVDFQDFIHAIRSVGGFWAVINEAPPWH